jgi:hypothetical protein
MRSITLLSLFSFACTNSVPADSESDEGQTPSAESDATESTEDTAASNSSPTGDESQETGESEVVEPVDEDGDGFTDDIDCNDHDPRIAPGAPEYCDGIDTDCDGVVDPNSALDALTWYRDGDGDGFGDPMDTKMACSAPGGPWVDNSEDCDDTNAAINPDASEICDGLDNDCDGVVDPPTSADAPTWYLDTDADGFGLSSEAVRSCTKPDGSWSVESTDCDDADARIHPGAEEFCDGLDFDCDGEEAAGIATWRAAGDPAEDVTANMEAGFLRRTELGQLSICEGVWTTRLEFEVEGMMSYVGAPLVLIEGYGDVVLDGGGDGRLITVDGSLSTLELSGLTLRNGEAEIGGALYGDQVDLIMSDVDFLDNSATGPGGAIYLAEGNIEMDGVSFRRNSSEGHGAHGGAVRLINGDIEGTDVVLSHNEASGMANGGAIAVLDGSVTLSDADISFNTASYRGGAIVLHSGDLTLMDSRVDHNSAMMGGALYVAGVVELAATQVNYNEADNGGAVYLAHREGEEALYCDADGVAQAGFTDNSAERGGAVYIESRWGYELQSAACDWGTGGSDNELTDIQISIYGGINAGMDATFSCETTVCMGDADYE